LALDLQDPAAARAALAFLVETACEAGAIAVGFFVPGARTTATIATKHGGSPVTEADLLANACIERRLRQEFPEAGWLSEETIDAPDRLARRTVLIVDPIDGTRGFIAGDPRWAVSIALVVDGRPVAGVVHAPALAETYAALLGQGATLNGRAIAASSRADFEGARIAGPRPLIDRLVAARHRLDIVPKIPSLAYRLVLIASGALDLALVKEDAHDWDIAAADLIMHEAGAALCTRERQTPRYNEPVPSHGKLFAAPTRLLPALVEAARQADRAL